jgi:hypothetical protein
VRVDADTSWLREREIEAAYRTRFEDRRGSDHALRGLYQEVLDSRGAGEGFEPWMICVARPRHLSAIRGRLEREDVDAMWSIAQRTLAYADQRFPSPLKVVDTFNPRAGLRRQVFRASGGASQWDEAWVTMHDDGAVTLCGVVSSPMRQGEEADPEFKRVKSVSVEAFVSDFMALVFASGEHHRLDDFDVMLGIEWRRVSKLLFETVDAFGHTFDGTSVPLGRYSNVTSTVSTRTSAEAYHRAVYDLALDAVNQGGITVLRCVNRPTDL